MGVVDERLTQHPEARVNDATLPPGVVADVAKHLREELYPAEQRFHGLFTEDQIKKRWAAEVRRGRKLPIPTRAMNGMQAPPRETRQRRRYRSQQPDGWEHNEGVGVVGE